MKRQIKRIVLTLLLCLIVFLVVSCGNENTPSHSAHSYTTKSNSTKHWKECSCGKHVEAENHSFGDWITTKEATLTSTGTKERKCSVCEYKEEETIPKSNHSHDYSNTYKSNSAKHWKECTCGQKKDEEVHTFGSWITTKEPTITTTGKKERECTVCGYEEEDTISKLTHSHNYSTMYKIDSTKHWKECSCGETTEEENHTFDSWEIIKENSFTEKGEQRRTCSKCSFEEKEEIPLKTEVETIEELIEYFGDQVNQNLSKQYEVVMKKVFGNSYQKLMDMVTNYQWDLGEPTADGKVQNLKLKLEYVVGTNTSIIIFAVNLKNALSLNDLLNYEEVSSTDTTYNQIFSFGYVTSQQNQRNELIEAILGVAVDDGFVYTMDDVKFVENSMSTDSDLGSVRNFTVVISNEKGIRKINVFISHVKTDEDLINKINNGKIKINEYKEGANFSKNLLPKVILK